MNALVEVMYISIKLILTIRRLIRMDTTKKEVCATAITSSGVRDANSRSAHIAMGTSIPQFQQMPATAGDHVQMTRVCAHVRRPTIVGKFVVLQRANVASPVVLESLADSRIVLTTAESLGAVRATCKQGNVLVRRARQVLRVSFLTVQVLTPEATCVAVAGNATGTMASVSARLDSPVQSVKRLSDAVGIAWTRLL